MNVDEVKASKSPNDVAEIKQTLEDVELEQEQARQKQLYNDLKSKGYIVQKDVKFYNPSIAHLRYIQYVCLEYVNDAEIADIIAYILAVPADQIEDTVGVAWDSKTISRNARQYCNQYNLGFSDNVYITNILYFDLLSDMNTDDDDAKKK